MPKAQTSTQFFRTLTTIHLALLGGQLFFLGIAVMLVEGGDQEASQSLNQVLRLPMVMLVVLAVISSRLVFRAMLTKAVRSSSITEKIGKYRSAQVVRWALVEVPILFCGASFIISHDYWLMLIAGLGLVYFILQWPSRQRAIFDLQLSSQETAILNDPNAIVAETSVTRGL